MLDLIEMAADKKRKDREAKFKDSFRLLCGGVVISEVPGRLGQEFALGMLMPFRDNLVAAFDDHQTFATKDFKMSPGEYLRFHSQRLGLPIVDDFVVVGPGEVYPLAPNLSAIV